MCGTQTEWPHANISSLMGWILLILKIKGGLIILSSLLQCECLSKMPLEWFCPPQKNPTERNQRNHHNIILDPSCYLLNIPLSTQTKNPQNHSLPEHTHVRDLHVIWVVVVFYCPLVCSQDSTLELNPSMNPEFACLQLDNWLIWFQNDENQRISTIQNLSSKSWYQAASPTNLTKSCGVQHHRLFHGHFSCQE